METDKVRPLSNRVPSLDGLRACSVFFVIFDHLSLSGALPTHQSWIDFGNLGVRIFFVISGFIITRLLIEESRLYGSISLKGFYIRRFFRIMPIWACYVAVILLGLWRRGSFPSAAEVLGVLTFNVDYIRVSATDLQHLWSLSVEEKFYLLWPFTLSFVGPRKAARIGLAVVVIVPFIRAFTIDGSNYADLLWPFHKTADAIAMGCLLAFAWEWIEKRSNSIAQRLSSPGFTLVAVAGIFGVAACHDLGTAFWLAGPSLMNLLAATVIYGVVANPNSFIGTFLNSSPMQAIGRWSYGIYLWQQPLTIHRKMGVLAVFPVNVVALLLIAVIGYYLIEKPAQGYGRRITARQKNRLCVAT